MSSSLLPQLDMLDRTPVLPFLDMPAVEERLGRLYRGPTLPDVLDELLLAPEAEDEEERDEEGPSPPLPSALSSELLLRLLASPLDPSPPEVDSSLMSLALLTELVSSKGRFFPAGDKGEEDLTTPCCWAGGFSAFLCAFFDDDVFLSFCFLPSFRFLRLGLALWGFLDRPVVATCDMGFETFDEPRLCCWRDRTSCCSIWFCCSRNCMS